SQLVSDTGGRIDGAAVTRYHRGRAEVTGFAVADRAVVGGVPGALEALRWALAVGVAHVLVADALADGVRSIARVSSAGRGNPYAMASALGMPPWKVKRAQSQARGWTAAGLSRAMRTVADLNADVKGVAADPSYALEAATPEAPTAPGPGGDGGRAQPRHADGRGPQRRRQGRRRRPLVCAGGGDPRARRRPRH